jgi:hypothetical protein
LSSGPRVQTFGVADTVAIVSVASSATVAVAVPFIGAQLERRRLNYQVTQERFGELRTQLDQSAEHMIDGVGVLATIAGWRPDAPRDEMPVDRLGELAIVIFQDNTRLGLRLGYDHGIVMTHSDAMQIFLEAEAKWRTEQVTPSVKDHQSLLRETAEFLTEARRIVAVPRGHDEARSTRGWKPWRRATPPPTGPVDPGGV